jgi:hypothetical protein
MKLALALLMVAGCGSSATHDSTTPTSGGSTSNGGTAAAVNGATDASARTQTQVGSSSTQTTASGGHYSCFDYKSRNTTDVRHACMATSECDPYRDQAMQVGGLVDVTGCASVSSIYCFHQPASKTDPEGLDVCQPSMDSCKSERALLVKKGTSVDTDCTSR